MIKQYSSQLTIAGSDEAGRGCLAGPVFAAAVILPDGFQHNRLNDSKLLSQKTRNELRRYIEKNAISYSVQRVDEKEIDDINILRASINAMHRAINSLSISPDLLLIDGNRFTPFPGIKHICVVKGDQKYFSIAAASILAKTYRDDFMIRLDEEFPQYQWAKNKGYGTKEHVNAIRKYGYSEFHRRSFKVKSLEGV